MTDASFIPITDLVVGQRIRLLTGFPAAPRAPANTVEKAVWEVALAEVDLSPEYRRVIVNGVGDAAPAQMIITDEEMSVLGLRLVSAPEA